MRFSLCAVAWRSETVCIADPTVCTPQLPPTSTLTTTDSIQNSMFIMRWSPAGPAGEPTEDGHSEDGEAGGPDDDDLLAAAVAAVEAQEGPGKKIKKLFAKRHKPPAAPSALHIPAPVCKFARIVRFGMAPAACSPRRLQCRRWMDYSASSGMRWKECGHLLRTLPLCLHREAEPSAVCALTARG